MVSKSSTTLHTLPCEVLLLIAHFLPLDSVFAVSRASSRLYSTLNPLVYRSLTIRATDEWALNVLDVDSFFLHHEESRARGLLRHTKHLQIQAPIHHARFNRCAYYSIFRMAGLSEHSPANGASHETTIHQRFLSDIDQQILRIFACLKPNSLHTFQWRLGICIPMGILGQGGYLSQHQTSLQHLVLITDGTCPQAQYPLEGLPSFPCLRSLEWEGLQHPAEAVSLRECIDRNRTHLANLTVGFISSASAQSLCWEAFADPWYELVGHAEDSRETPINSSLVSLSLSRITFPSELSRGYISTFTSLKSLSLFNCPNQLRLLHSLSRASRAIHLQSFQACFDFLLHDTDEGCAGVVADFLSSFRGLRDLCLRLSNFPLNESLVKEGIQSHHSTLRSLVYHERQLIPLDNNDGLFEDERDVHPVWIADLSTVVDLRQITALALSINPAAAQQHLEPARGHSKLELLHLRFSGPDYMHRYLTREIDSLLCKSRQPYPLRDVKADPFLPLYTENYETEHSHCDLAATQHGQTADTKPSASSTEADEFLSFAKWAFSPDGLPSLQVLGFGDFSHEDRYQSQRFLVRRLRSSKIPCPTPEILPFYPIELSDPHIWDGVSVDGARFLGACPGGGIMESPYEF